MAKIVPDTWALPAKLQSKVGLRVGRQRLLSEGGHHLLVLHQLPKPHVRERHAIAFWRDPAGRWRAYPGKDGPEALREHVEKLADVIDDLDDDVERARTATEFLEVLQVARPLERYARNLYLVVSELRDALPDDEGVLTARDRAYEVGRVIEGIAEDASNGMQHTIARHTEEQARLSMRIAKETHRLNLLAAVALPITAVGAILGMNLTSGMEGWPEPSTFWLIVAFSLGIGVYIRMQIRADG